MKTRTVFVAVALAGAILALPVLAADNSWISTGGGYWQGDANWSQGVPPDSSYDWIYLTNANTKTVLVHSSIPASTLTVGNLMISGPAGTTNTLSIGYVVEGFDPFTLSEGPFVVSGNLTISSGGKLWIAAASTTRVDGVSAGVFTVNGTVQMDTGLLVTTNCSTTIGEDGVGRMTVTNGTWLAKSIYLGCVDGSQGTLILAGGTTALSEVLSIGRSGLPDFGPAYGTLMLTGGQLTTTNAATQVGYNGVGLMIVSNGTWLAKDMYVADGGADYGAQGTMIIAGGTNILSGSLRVGNSVAGNGSVLISGGQLVVTNNTTYIGDTAAGQMTVNNGTWLAKDVSVGNNAGSRGTLTIAGGTNSLTGYLYLGYFAGATGTVWLTGGQLTVTNYPTYIGGNGVGQMTVSNGTLQAYSVYVGVFGGSQGTLTIAGGTNRFSWYLVVGYNSGATGTVWLTGGQLTVTNGPTFIGNYGVGQMTVSNSTWLAKDVSVGNNAGSQGTLTIAGGTNSLAGNLQIGYNPNATGTVLLTGGQLVATNTDTYIGRSGVGQMTVSNGTWLAKDVYVGELANSQGTLNIGGGTNTISSSLTIGNATTATGRVFVTGGQLTVTSGTTRVGFGGNGQMQISGGTTYLRDVNVGQYGTLTVAGGTLRLSGTLGVGAGAGGGKAQLTGGNIVVESTATLRLGTDVTTVGSMITNQGVFQLLAGAVTLNGGFDNQANFTVTGGQSVNVQNGLANEGFLTVSAAGALTADRFAGGTHDGSLFLYSGAGFTVNSAWTNAGAVSLQGGVVLGSAVANTALIEGYGGLMAPLANGAGGTVRANGGILSLSGSSVQNQAGGIFEALPGATLKINRSMLNQGLINPQGGAIDLGANTLTNFGTLSGYGSYKAGLIVNQSRATFSGGNLNIYAAYLNTGASTTTEVRYITANFYGGFTNAASAVFKNTGSQITFFGPTAIGGTYASDPAINTFNGSVVLDPTGVLAGGAGDVFIISGDLTSANPNGLQLAGAKVVFNSGAHTFTLAGTAQIGELELQSGASILLAGGDLIVGLFSASTDQFTTAQTIYYDPAQNPSLGAQTYALDGGGSLTAVPEPSSGLLVLFAVAASLLAARRRLR
jgi:T5SS/PEP-CTERM-associated repeat protein